MFNKNNFSAFGYEFVNDDRIESWQVIVKYLNGLQDMDIFDVLLSLSRVTRSRSVIERFMSSSIDDIKLLAKVGIETNRKDARLGTFKTKRKSLCNSRS